MESLNGKNALITGAGKGIGKALAIALAKEGVNVALLARTSSDLQAVADDVEKEGVKAVIGTADVADINPDKVMQPEDFAELIISQLKLNRRVFVKDAAIWSTNP